MSACNVTSAMKSNYTRVLYAIFFNTSVIRESLGETLVILSATQAMNVVMMFGLDNNRIAV